MAEPQQIPKADLIVGRKQMLFAVPVDDDGEESIRYVVEAVDGDSQPDDEDIQQALNVIGAWSDLDWEEAADELDRIRHGSQPTPPLELP